MQVLQTRHSLQPGIRLLPRRKDAVSFGAGIPAGVNEIISKAAGVGPLDPDGYYTLVTNRVGHMTDSEATRAQTVLAAMTLYKLHHPRSCAPTQCR